MYAVGLMSGTSLDGVDIVLVDIEGYSMNTKINVIAFNTYDIPKNIKLEIKKACNLERSNVELICSLNFKLGYLFAECVKRLCKENNFDVNKLGYIASHGQTIYHIPKAKEGIAASTLQIGESAVIAYETGIKVISNFRVMDMAAGGEGAPLVPFTEYILYRQIGEGVILQNIGGIGNATIIPNSNNIDDLYAFDTGPGNMIVDELMERLYKKKYDANGDVASKGNINKDMLKDMMANPYILATPPKTTGREVFGEKYVDELLKRYGNFKNEDIIATATMFTAKSIAENYKKFILKKHSIKKVLIGGGGAHNRTLIKNLKNLLPNLEILTQDEIGYSSDAKEAIAFVILGNETLNHSFSNIPSATGAKCKVVLGNICESPFMKEER